MLLAGGREAASFTKAFLLSAPCHWSSIQLDLQVPGYGLTPLTTRLIGPLIPVSSWSRITKAKI